MNNYLSKENIESIQNNINELYKLYLIRINEVNTPEDAKRVEQEIKNCEDIIDKKNISSNNQLSYLKFSDLQNSSLFKPGRDDVKGAIVDKDYIIDSLNSRVPTTIDDIESMVNHKLLTDDELNNIDTKINELYDLYESRIFEKNKDNLQMLDNQIANLASQIGNMNIGENAVKFVLPNEFMNSDLFRSNSYFDASHFETKNFENGVPSLTSEDIKKLEENKYYNNTDRVKEENTEVANISETQTVPVDNNKKEVVPVSNDYEVVEANYEEPVATTTKVNADEQSSDYIPTAEEYHMNPEAYDDYVAQGYVPGTKEFEDAARLDGQPFTPLAKTSESQETSVTSQTPSTQETPVTSQTPATQEYRPETTLDVDFKILDRMLEVYQRTSDEFDSLKNKYDIEIATKKALDSNYDPSKDPELAESTKKLTDLKSKLESQVIYINKFVNELKPKMALEVNKLNKTIDDLNQSRNTYINLLDYSEDSKEVKDIDNQIKQTQDKINDINNKEQEVIDILSGKKRQRSKEDKKEIDNPNKTNTTDSTPGNNTSDEENDKEKDESEQKADDKEQEKYESKNEEMTPEEKAAKRKAKIQKAVFFGLGVAAGVGISFIPGPVPGVIIGVNRALKFTSNLAKKYASKHQDNPDNIIVKMVAKGEELKDPEKHPRISKVIAWYNKPNVQAVLNGVMVGYAAGKVGQMIKGQMDAAKVAHEQETQNAVKSDPNTQPEPDPQPQPKPNPQPDPTPTPTPTKEPSIDLDHIDASNFEYAYRASTDSKPLHIISSYFKDCKIVNTNVVDGKQMIALGSQDGTPLGWFNADDLGITQEMLKEANYISGGRSL